MRVGVDVSDSDLALCDGKVSELQVQKLSLNTFSNLKTYKSTCTGIGTRAHNGDENPFPSSEMT